VADLVFEVMGLEMPCPANPVPSSGIGHDWSVDGRAYHDNGEPLELAMGYFWDLWRREQVGRLVEERGLPAEVVKLAWAALPYESVPFRLGWDAWVLYPPRAAGEPPLARRRLGFPPSSDEDARNARQELPRREPYSRPVRRRRCRGCARVLVRERRVVPSLRAGRRQGGDDHSPPRRGAESNPGAHRS
jgi:hypothetical protein